MRPPVTENVRAGLDDLDCRTPEAIVTALLEQEARAQTALREATASLARLAEAVAGRLATGGRLFYAGAGTSGRLAVLDAVECGPTFSVAPGIIIPIIAGGTAAITGAVEGAEDDTKAPEAALAQHDLGPRDALVGIAASGSTPFTLAAIAAARSRGALTGCIVNCPGPIADAVDIAVIIETGAEIIAGSTRLSAGTAQKVALNTLSTTVMIKLGKNHGPYMVDVKPTNDKLRRRAVRTIYSIAHCDEDTAATALTESNHEVKTAIVMILRNTDANAARAILATTGQRLRPAIMP